MPYLAQKNRRCYCLLLQYFWLILMLWVLACGGSLKEKKEFEEISESSFLELMDRHREDSAPRWLFHGADQEFLYFSEKRLWTAEGFKDFFKTRRVKISYRPTFFCEKSRMKFDREFPQEGYPVYRFQVACP